MTIPFSSTTARPTPGWSSTTARPWNVLTFFALLLLLPFPLGAIAAPPSIRLADLEEGATVEVPATRQLTVDFTGSSLLDDPAHRLLVIQLQGDGRSDYYSVNLEPGRRSYLLNADTLQPHAAPPFPGFHSGGAVYLLIGKEAYSGSLRLGIFDARWQIYPQVR